MQYLEGFKANLVADRTGLCMDFLVRVYVEAEHHLERLHCALQEEDQQSADLAHLQVIRK